MTGIKTGALVRAIGETTEMVVTMIVGGTAYCSYQDNDGDFASASHTLDELEVVAPCTKTRRQHIEDQARDRDQEDALAFNDLFVEAEIENGERTAATNIVQAVEEEAAAMRSIERQIASGQIMDPKA